MKKNLAFMCSLTMDELGITKRDETNAVVETLNAKDLTYQKKAKERDRYLKRGYSDKACILPSCP